MTGTGMALGVKCQIVALIRVRQYLPSTPFEDYNGVATAIKMILGNDTLHTKPTVNALLFVRLHHVQTRFGLEKREFVKEEFRRTGITGIVIAIMPQPIKR